MAKKNRAPAAPSSYQLLGQRIQRVISSPRAQSDRYAVIGRTPEESVEDWERLLEELETVTNLTLTRHDDGAVSLRWNPEESMA